MSYCINSQEGELQAPDSALHMSIFDTCKTVDSSDSISLKKLIAQIRTGYWSNEVKGCRSILTDLGAKVYKSSRSAIPAVTLSAHLKTRKSNATLEEKEAVHSGFLQLDFDAKDHEGMSVEEIREIVESAPFVASCFLSLSGAGVKGIARCPAEFESHLGSWLTAESYFKERGLTLDPATKDPYRLCFVSYDPTAYHCDEAEKLVPIEVLESSHAVESSHGEEDPKHVRCVLAKLSETIGAEQDRNTWLHICACTKDAVGAEAGAELVDEFFPPVAEDHQSACDVMGTLKSGAWGSLRKYGINPTDYPRLMPEYADTNLSLRERAYTLRFNPNETPPADELCMDIDDIPIAARGNLTVIQGKAKSGKSAMISAVLGAAHRGEVVTIGDTLCINWQGKASGAIIHMDTEQSLADWHGLVSRSLTRSGIPDMSSRLVSLPIVMFTRSERLKILRETMEYERAEQGAIDLVILDGVADLCISPNDEVEALDLVSKIHALSQEFECPIFCVLHENPSTDQGKTRGHLGSELNRKAFGNIRIDKNNETGISTIYGTDMRKRDIPKNHGFCFGWDDDAKMHTFQGRAADLKATTREEKAKTKARLRWESVFELAENGTDPICPELTPEQAIDIERDIPGTKKLVSFEAMKKRMQRAEALGILKKTEAGTWTLSSWDI